MLSVYLFPFLASRNEWDLRWLVPRCWLCWIQPESFPTMLSQALQCLTEAVADNHNWDHTEPQMGLIWEYIAQQIKKECTRFADLCKKNVRNYLTKPYEGGVSPRSKRTLLRIKITQVCTGSCICSAYRYSPVQIQDDISQDQENCLNDLNYGKTPIPPLPECKENYPRVWYVYQLSLMD